MSQALLASADACSSSPSSSPWYCFNAASRAGQRGVCQDSRVTSRLVILGGCGAWPEAGRACSGFVLEHAGARIVLDLGYGTLPRLLALLGSSAADGIDAVVV